MYKQEPQHEYSEIQSLLTPDQVAKYLGITTRSLANWRSSGSEDLPWTKAGGSIRYRLSDVDAYLSQNTVNHVETVQ